MERATQALNVIKMHRVKYANTTESAGILHFVYVRKKDVLCSKDLAK